MLALMILLALTLLLIFVSQGLDKLSDPSDNSRGVMTGKTEPGAAEKREGMTPEEELMQAAAEVPMGEVIRAEDESQGPGVPVALKYESYPISDTYFVVLSQGVPLREVPSGDGREIAWAETNEKLNYLETVTVKTPAGGGNWTPVNWYHVTLTRDGDTVFGFIREGDASKRVFQFEKMEQAVKAVDAKSVKGGLTYISNYKNGKGLAPAYKGGDRDQRGGRRSQSAPGYPDPGNPDEFIYLGDGTLVKTLTVSGDYIRVELLSTGEALSVPKKYVPTLQALDHLTRAIVVDRENQNEACFEKIQGEWTLVSRTLSTTGTENTYAQITPLGYFYAMERREEFYYYKDGTTTVQGYAPYAIRFAGGAYVHGLPVSYQYSEGKRIIPGHREYSDTIGTVPLSHKCVRNYTSHAKFLYDWYQERETLVIVIE